MMAVKANLDTCSSLFGVSIQCKSVAFMTCIMSISYTLFNNSYFTILF